MSKHYNDCDIVIELLPLYLDRKTCEESNAFVEEHLLGCVDCRGVHELMSAEFPEGREAMTEDKKSKRKRRRLSPARKRTIMLVTGLTGYFFLMVAVVAYAVWLLFRV